MNVVHLGNNYRNTNETLRVTVRPYQTFNLGMSLKMLKTLLCWMAASPALGAIQEPIPDFRFTKYINKTMLSCL